MDNIDFEALRRDLINYFESAFLIGGFGAAAISASDVYSASNQRLIELAQECGFNLSKYITYVDIKKYTKK